MIYYGLQILNPTIFLPACLIICAVISLATGSSWTTAATVGIALIGIAEALGIPLGMTAGAVLSGAYFGDKMSPMSDTTNLAPAMAGTDLFTHIKYMAYTTIPTFIITLIIFVIIGLTLNVNGEAADTFVMLRDIDKAFNINPWLFLVPSLGHCHPKVVKAVKNQLDKYLHVMVYGEFVQEPAVHLTKLLHDHLPDNLTTTYLTNSGTEAIEGAIKLARRATERKEIIYAKKAYHGSTLGALSILGVESQKQIFKPLIPECHAIEFNAESELLKITNKTAGVILETIQGGAGFIVPKSNYLKKVKKRCEEVGALLILDEIQPGFGRTGKLFGFEHFEISPDILVVGKGMGGGMPIGGFIASNELMMLLSNHPKLGHITTFGGNPVKVWESSNKIDFKFPLKLLDFVLFFSVCSLFLFLL